MAKKLCMIVLLALLQDVLSRTGAYWGNTTTPSWQYTYHGITGARGRTGSRGKMGRTGVTGWTGYFGGRGATGPMGPTGDPGHQGHAGRTGATGPRGKAKGEPGTMGATGPVGERGATGPAGKTGQPTEGCPNGFPGTITLVWDALLTLWLTIASAYVAITHHQGMKN